MKKIIINLTTASLVLFPAVASAQFAGIKSLIVFGINPIVNYLTILVTALALLAFFWGLAKFIYRSGDEKAVAEGKKIMLWGIVALFVMFSIWGIIKFFQNALLPSGNLGAPTLPVFP